MISINNRIELNLFIRNVITQYINNHNITFREYAKLVEIPWYVLMALQRGAIKITDMKYEYVLRILDFHNYISEFKVYQTSSDPSLQTMKNNIETII